MKKQNESRLSLEKFRVARLTNLRAVIGGQDDGPVTPSAKTEPPKEEKEKEDDKN